MSVPADQRLRTRPLARPAAPCPFPCESIRRRQESIHSDLAPGSWGEDSRNLRFTIVESLSGRLLKSYFVIRTSQFNYSCSSRASAAASAISSVVLRLL